MLLSLQSWKSIYDHSGLPTVKTFVHMPCYFSERIVGAILKPEEK